MQVHAARTEPKSRFWSPCAMRDELCHALTEALYELDMLPRCEEDGAIMGLYAVMDDLNAAIDRIQARDVNCRRVAKEG